MKSVLTAAQRGDLVASRRIAHIESLIQRRLPAEHRALGAPGGLDGDTLFGTVQIGGTSHDLTMHFLDYQQIVELK